MECSIARMASEDMPKGQIDADDVGGRIGDRQFTRVPDTCLDPCGKAACSNVLPCAGKGPFRHIATDDARHGAVSSSLDQQRPGSAAWIENHVPLSRMREEHHRSGNAGIERTGHIADSPGAGRERARCKTDQDIPPYASRWPEDA